MMGVLAEFERAIILERVRAGLARAKSEGKRLGRPTIPGETQSAIRAALAERGRPGRLQLAAALADTRKRKCAVIVAEHPRFVLGEPPPDLLQDGAALLRIGIWPHGPVNRLR